MPWQIICNNSEILAIHAALLPIGNRGQVVLFGGDEHNPAQAGNDSTPANPMQVDNTRIHDLDTNPAGVITIGSPTTDVFCSGHAFLGDGRLMIGGGTESWEGGGGPGGGHVHGLGNFGGHPACWVFNFSSRTWQRVADFNFRTGTATGEGEGGGRWYPTLLTLPSGDVIAISGHPSRRSREWHNNNIPEIYSASSNSWRQLPRHDEITFYPRMHLIRRNQIFIASGTGGDSRILDLNTETVTSQVISRPSGANNFYESWDNSSVLLPLLPSDEYQARILMCNDVQPIRIDIDGTPTWQDAGTRSMTRRRQYACSTLLPDGKILVSGGMENPDDDTTGVREAEIYDPGINWNADPVTYNGTMGTWTTGDAATVPRNYHSTALLLPDGSVWTAGSSKGADAGDPATFAEMRIEIFEPDYFNNPNRPDLTNSPQSIDYNSTSFTLRTPQRNQIKRVAFIRCGSTTHAGDFDQRYVGLSFTPTPGVPDGLTITYPTDPSVLPPGYYMLWIINDLGLPCKNSKFVRVARRGSHILLDHSTFSSLEIEALLSAGSVARFSKALYVVLDGYLPGEVSGAPSIQLFYDMNGGPGVPNVTIELNGAAEFEHTPTADEVPQRITFAFDVVFNDMSAVSPANLPSTDRNVMAVARFGNHVAQGNLKFTRNPNPYMTDGSIEWLSTDVRVFKIKMGEARAGITQSANPNQFIRNLLTQFNTQPSNGSHPFLSIATDPEASSLELAGVSGFPPVPVYNYAVAKVRYRALSTEATDVQVFFRMFQAGTTDVSFNEGTTYRRSGSGSNAIPLLGKFGSAIASIPFFADERIDSSGASMTTQTDNTNRRTLAPNGAMESVTYFGCWLDINQTTPQFPLIVPGDGPFTAAPFSIFNPLGRLSIQQLMRGTHQCLVAEIRYALDPIPFGATPGSNDNLSQRNVVLDHSDNPGSPDSHIVRHPFELKPTTGNGIFSPPYDNSFLTNNLTKYSRGNHHPDELMIDWGNLPRTSIVSVYLPAVAADDILSLQTATRVSSSVLEKADENTIQCRGGADVTYIPIPPSGKIENLAGLFTVELPNNVVKGQVFHAVMHQVEGTTRRIIGTFQLTIPVSTADVLLPMLTRKLSVLKHIQLAIPPADRWYQVFNRYVGHFSDKIKALGGDPAAVMPSSSGLGADAAKAKWTLCLTLQWLVALLLAVLCVVIALVPMVTASIAATVLVTALLAAGSFYGIRCRPDSCSWLKTFLIGLNIGAAVLCATYLIVSISTMALLATVSILGILNFVLLILLLWKRCCYQDKIECK